MNGGRRDRQDREYEEECKRHEEQMAAMERLSCTLDGIAGSIRQAGRNIARATDSGTDLESENDF